LENNSDSGQIYDPHEKAGAKLKERIGKGAFRIVEIDKGNLDRLGLMCQKSKKSGEGYRNKLKWTKERFEEGLRIRMLLVDEGPKRGNVSKGFIEYIPGEFAWRGIDAKGYMVIHCIWVVGWTRGHGYGSELLEHCENDAKGMNGVAVVTSDQHWLPNKNLFRKHGYEEAGMAQPGFEILVKRFSRDSPLPKFNATPRQRLDKYRCGITVFKSDQCPYTADSLKEIKEVAAEHDLPLAVESIGNCNEAQNSVHPYGTYCVLINGKVVTYRPIGKKRMNELLTQAENV
jgi:GNAT superfamily N-acetyltransferase